MHPMARKLNVHNEAFVKAIESGDAEGARGHLSEIMKYASYLEEDLHFAILKAEKEPVAVAANNEFVNNVPLIKWNETGSKFNEGDRSRQLPGTVFPARNNPQMRRSVGTFGRRLN